MIKLRSKVVKSCPGSYNKKVVEWESRLQNTLNHQAALTPSCLLKAGSLFFAVSFFLSQSLECCSFLCRYSAHFLLSSLEREMYRSSMKKIARLYKDMGDLKGRGYSCSLLGRSNAIWRCPTSLNEPMESLGEINLGHNWTKMILKLI